MISFCINYYKLSKIQAAAGDYNLRFGESNGRGTDSKRLYGFYKLSENHYRNVSRGWSIAEAYAVLNTRGDFSHIRREGTNRADSLFELGRVLISKMEIKMR